MIITVASFKGGVGKTTTAVHLAAYLQGQAETVLIDADPNRSALGWASRGELPYPVLDQWQAEQQLRPYSHMVIDTPARPTAADLTALAASCDLLVLPTTPDVLALDALVLTVDFLRSSAVSHYQILLTAVPPKPSRAAAEVRAVLVDAGLPLFDQDIRRLAAFQKAALEGVPVYEVKDPRAELGWQDYGAVGLEILAANRPDRLAELPQNESENL